MQTAFLLTTSILAVVISILTVQLPRYLEQYEASTQTQDDVPIGPMTDDAGPSTSPSPSRKPWDPPFPTTQKQASKENSRWLILPPSFARKGHAASDGARKAQDGRVEGVEPGNEQVKAPPSKRE